MVKEEYIYNKEGLREIINYLTYLRNNSVTVEEKKISQRMMAKYLGICNAEVNRLEKGERLKLGVDILFSYMSLFDLSEEQMIQFYRCLCDKDSKLKIVDEPKKLKNIDSLINKEILFDLKYYFLKRRSELGYSQNDLEKIIGLSNAEVSRIETGRREVPTIYSLIPLCKFYNISEEEVIKFYKRVINSEKINNVSDKLRCYLESLTKEELIDLIIEEKVKVRVRK